MSMLHLQVSPGVEIWVVVSMYGVDVMFALGHYVSMRTFHFQVSAGAECGSGVGVHDVDVVLSGREVCAGETRAREAL